MNDILFQIDMILYNEFNDKFCEINEHLGDIYTYKDLEDIKQCEADKERKLLREAIQKQEKVIDEIIQTYLLKHSFLQSEVCKNHSRVECNNYRENGGCNNCIKQYFYRKV